MLLQRVKQTVQDAGIGPTAHPGVNRVPIPKTRRQGAPRADVLSNKENGVDHRQGRNPHIPAPNRQMGADESVLLFRYRIHNTDLK